MPEDLFTVIQAISVNNTDDVVNVTFEQYHLAFKSNWKSLLVPGGIEIRYIGSSRHAHGEAIDLSDVLPQSVDFAAEYQVVLLNRKQFIYEICFHFRRAGATTEVIHHQVP